MAEINYSVYDRTLRAVDKAMEERKNSEHARNYLGMSAIGEECERKLFYSFRDAEKRFIQASGIRAIEDGFAQEDVMAYRLRQVPGIKLITEQDGAQIGFSSVDGHFRGHCDGMIYGILERPEKWHVWEHKSVNEAKFNKLSKLRDEHGEKSALEKWDEIYYAQAQIYMHSAKVDRHYLTVTSPGGRDYISIRTALNEKAVDLILRKAHRIIYSTTIPAKISEKSEYFKCKICEYSGICHGEDEVRKSCGTCEAFAVIPEKFQCKRKNEEMENQVPCKEWNLNPLFAKAINIEQQSKESKVKTFAWSK